MRERLSTSECHRHGERRQASAAGSNGEWHMGTGGNRGLIQQWVPSPPRRVWPSDLILFVVVCCVFFFFFKHSLQASFHSHYSHPLTLMFDARGALQFYEILVHDALGEGFFMKRVINVHSHACEG